MTRLQAVVGARANVRSPALLTIAAYVATQCVDGDRAETNLMLDWTEVRRTPPPSKGGGAHRHSIDGIPSFEFTVEL